ncbi:MAG: hypothetical protein HYZ75_04590 [Elusimicrobia bacterium]|nr:hypothetical protein [Elusimicrobiota bacterium]
MTGDPIVVWRTVAFCAATFLAGCAVPPHRSRPSRLGPTRTNRVQAAYANLRPALAEWDLETYGRDCLLLYEEKEEWLLGCSEMAGKSGFEATGEVWDAHAILWNEPALTLSEKHLPYENIKLSMVGTVGTHKDEKGGAPNPVLIIQEWDALHKNHPGFQDAPIEEWLGVFVHEAFHARQMWHPQVRAVITRWDEPNRPVTGDDLASFYTLNEGFRAALHAEFALLEAATGGPQLPPIEARRVLADWLRLYRARERAFGPALEAAFPGRDAWFMDGFETFLEGSARYVESKFLISPQPVTLGSLNNEPTYRHFEQSLGKGPAQLPGLGKPGSKYFYALGMHLCHLLDSADPAWKSRVFESDRLLIGQVERASAGL